MRRGNLLHPFQRLDAALRLACFGGLGSKTVYVAVQMRNLSLLLFVAGLLVCQVLGANHLKIRVVAGIEPDTLLLDMRNLRDHCIQKIPIMRDQQQRAGVATEPLLQPDHRIQIQMVGRLIQQQQI